MTNPTNTNPEDTGSPMQVVTTHHVCENTAFEAAASASNVPVEVKDEQERRERMAEHNRRINEEHAARVEAIRQEGLQLRQTLADALNAAVPASLKATHKVVLDPKWGGSLYNAGLDFEGRPTEVVGLRANRQAGAPAKTAFGFYNDRGTRFTLRRDGTFNPEFIQMFWKRVENDIAYRAQRVSADSIKAQSQVLVDRVHAELKAIGFTYVPVSACESEPTKVILRLIDSSKLVTPEVAIEALTTLKRLGVA